MIYKLPDTLKNHNLHFGLSYNNIGWYLRIPGILTLHYIYMWPKGHRSWFIWPWTNV